MEKVKIVALELRSRPAILSSTTILSWPAPTKKEGEGDIIVGLLVEAHQPIIIIGYGCSCHLSLVYGNNCIIDRPYSCRIRKQLVLPRRSFHRRERFAWNE